MNTCRTCKSNRLKLFLELGLHPPAQRFMTAAQLSEPEPMAPLDSYACLDCGLIQVPDNVPPGFFNHYLYVSSTSERLKNHFVQYAARLRSSFATDARSLIIDIGSCDGVLLAACKQLGARTLGIEPASNLVKMAEAKGLTVVNAYFSAAEARRVRDAHGPAKVVTASNTFNVVDDLDDFVEGVDLLLDSDGVFIIEVPRAIDLIKKNEFDTIYHEHVSEFSLSSLVKLFAPLSMQVFDVENIDLHGGSMRVFVQKRGAGRPVSSAVADMLQEELAGGLFDAETYAAFTRRVERNKATTLAMLNGLKKSGSRIAGYGAAAKGTTLLNYYGIGREDIEFIADRNTLKHGLYSPGKHIPIIPPEQILERRIDYLLILAWNFADEIMAEQSEFRARGGKFIVPIPEPVIVT